MKKLNKLCINTEKLMKNEELITLRGGYGGSCACKDGGTTICSTYGIPCNICRAWCYNNCSNYETTVCTGW